MTPGHICDRYQSDLMRGFLFGAVPILVVGLTSANAFGQDVATAEALFNKGVAEIKRENYKDACPAIEQSQKLDPRPGTQFTLAECFARWGKSATAHVTFEDFLRTVRALPAGQQGRYADRIKVAENKKSEIKPTIPELTIVLPKDAPSTIQITRDGTEVTGPMLGLALPVDPGEHTIVVEMPGKPAETQKITLSSGERKTLEVTIPGTTREEDGGPGDKKPISGRTIGTIAAFGVGAAGLVLGGFAGGAAISNKKQADTQCPDFKCSPEGLALVQEGRTMATLSTVGVVVGGAGIAAGVILLLTRPKTQDVGFHVSASPHAFSLTVNGVWQ